MLVTLLICIREFLSRSSSTHYSPGDLMLAGLHVSLWSLFGPLASQLERLACSLGFGSESDEARKSLTSGHGVTT